MSFATSDTKDVQESTDAAQESTGATKPLNPAGVKAMQGGDVTGAQPIPPPDDPPPPGDWVDRGIVDVPVADLPDPEGVKDAGDFEKVSAEDMKAGISRLQEMKPVIDTGEGASTDHWREFDREARLDLS